MFKMSDKFSGLGCFSERREAIVIHSHVETQRAEFFIIEMIGEVLAELGQSLWWYLSLCWLGHVDLLDALA